MRIKTIVSLLVVFSLVLGNLGMANAASATNTKSSAPMFVLKTISGDFFGLYVLPYYDMYGLYGLYYSPFAGVLWNVYGLLEGNEMVLWIDGAGTGWYPDSIAVGGKWNFQTNVFSGTWVNFKFPDTCTQASTQMWLYGIIPTEARESEMTLSTASLYKFQDSHGFTWELNFLYGFFYDGMVHQYQWWAAYGFKLGDEMFLWADAPENPSVHDFVYTGKYNATQNKYLGAWLDFEGQWSNPVQWWSIP